MCTVSFKIDDKEKVQAQELFESMGLSFSGAINLFIKACLNSRSIPFEIKAPSYEQILKNRIYLVKQHSSEVCDSVGTV